MSTERAATSREADDLPIGRVPFIGRMQERAAIAQAVSRSITESCCEVVTLVGNAGVGKTRLIDEVLADLRERYPSLRDYRGTARPGAGLQPAIARILRERFGLDEGADALAQANQVCGQVMDLFGDRRVDEILHFLCAFLGLRAGTTALAEAVDEDPRTFQLVSLAVLRRFFEVDAQRSPVALVFEDIHCASAEGIQMLRSLLDGLRGAPIVVFCTARPELLTRAHDFCSTPRERHLRVDLGPLSVSESEFLARSLLAAIDPCPRALLDAAVRMGGGNPQLTHTLVRIFFDQGIVTLGPDGAGRIDLDRLAQVSLPMSIEDAVYARVAALTPAERELLERAALMGPVFWVGGLVVLGRLGHEAPALWGGGEDLAHHYRDLLHALEQREFVQKLPRSSIPGEEEYVFRNSLEREHLEGSVPEENARKYCQVVAEWLEFRFDRDDFGPRRDAPREHIGRTEEQWDQLARHFERGDRKLRAARCYKASAEIARHRYANQKAIEHYSRALAMFGDHDVALRLEVHEHFGGVLRTVGNIDEAFKQYSAMLALAWRFDLKNKGGAAHNLIGRLYRDAGNLDEAMRHFGTGLALYEAADDQRGIASSFDDIGYTHWRRGAFETAERFLQDGLDRREALGDERSIALSLNNISLVYQETGQYRRAREALTRALVLREQVGDKPGKVATLNNLGELHKDLGEHERAINTWRQALETAREIGDRRRQAVLMLNIGQGKYRLGDTDESIRILSEVEDLCVELGDRLVLAEARRALGKAYYHHGDIARAEHYLERALELFEFVRSRSHTAIAQRSLAQVLRAYGHDDEKGRRAEALFRKALAAFEELGAEIQLARTGKELAEFLLETPDGRPPSPATFAEADELRARAEDIFDKLRRDSSHAEIPEGLLRTNPGLSRLRAPSAVPIPPPEALIHHAAPEALAPLDSDDEQAERTVIFSPTTTAGAPSRAPHPPPGVPSHPPPGVPSHPPQTQPPSSPSGSAFSAVSSGTAPRPLVPRATGKPPPVPPKPPTKD